jgi:long-chain acyl-CoA synthetase
MSSAVKPTAEAAQGPAYQWLRKYPKDVDWFQRFRPLSMGQLLDQAVAKYGNRTCTNFLGRKLTYAEIGGLVNRTAAGLQKLGVKKDTKVGLFMPNCPTFIVYYFAVLKAGGTVVNYNPLYTHDELTFQVRDSDTELMVTLDLKVLFDKVEALLKAGAPSWPPSLPCSRLRSRCCSSCSRARSWSTRESRPLPTRSSSMPTCSPTPAPSSPPISIP